MNWDREVFPQNQFPASSAAATHRETKREEHSHSCDCRCQRGCSIRIWPSFIQLFSAASLLCAVRGPTSPCLCLNNCLSSTTRSFLFLLSLLSGLTAVRCSHVELSVVLNLSLAWHLSLNLSFASIHVVFVVTWTISSPCFVPTFLSSICSALLRFLWAQNKGSCKAKFWTELLTFVLSSSLSFLPNKCFIKMIHCHWFFLTSTSYTHSFARHRTGLGGTEIVEILPQFPLKIKYVLNFRAWSLHTKTSSHLIASLKHDSLHPHYFQAKM